MPKWPNTRLNYNSNLLNKVKLGEEDSQLDIDSNHLFKYVISSTKTTLTLASAPKILEKYIISLTIEQCSLGRLTKKIFRNYNLFQGVIDFPQGSLVKHITGEVSRSKTVAMEKACWKAVVELYNLNALDDFLNPIYSQPDSESNLNHKTKIYKCVCSQVNFKGIEYYKLKVPKILKDKISLDSDNQMFLNYLDFNYFDCANGNITPNLGFITTKQLNEDLRFSLYVKGKEIPVLIKQAITPCNLPAKYISTCITFTRALLNNNNFEPNFLILPLLSSGSTINCINIKFIYNFLNISFKSNNDRFIENSMITESFIHSLEPRISSSEYSRSRSQFGKKIINIITLLKPQKANQFNRCLGAELNLKPGLNSKKYDEHTLNQLLSMPYYTIKSLKTLQIIPAILHSTYHAMLISEVKALLDEPKIDLQQLLIAFTDPSAKMDYNNLKLSQLGAAFINFAITLIVYCSYPKASESELHNRRVHILKNSIIFYNEYIYELSSYINTTSQNSVNSYYQSILNNMTNRQDIKLMQRSSESTLTKNIKAIVGACVNTQGIDKEELGFNIMGKLMYTILTEYKDFKKVCKNELRSGDISDLKSQIDSVECIIGYKFTNKHLLIQALTHKSYISKITDSYERLEFLGDKVLEYMLCQFLYNNYGELSPKNFAKIKQICATNKVLFELCIKSGLNEYIISDISMSKRLKKSLSNTKYQQITHKYNKVCSDIIESITGALFIDSEFNNNTVYKFIDKLLGPIINQYVAYEHGSEYTNQALNRLKLSKCKKCNVIFDLVKNSEIPVIKSRTRYIIHNKVVSESQCDCSAESSYKAALSFIDQINANNRLITELCNC